MASGLFCHFSSFPDKQKCDQLHGRTINRLLRAPGAGAAEPVAYGGDEPEPEGAGDEDEDADPEGDQDPGGGRGVYGLAKGAKDPEYEQAYETDKAEAEAYEKVFQAVRSLPGEVTITQSIQCVKGVW